MNKQEERIYDKLMDILESNISEIHNYHDMSNCYSLTIFEPFRNEDLIMKITFLSISINGEYRADKDSMTISRIFNHKQYKDLRHAIKYKLERKKKREDSRHDINGLDIIENIVTLKDDDNLDEKL